MTQSIRIRRAGDRIVIEDVELTREHGGVLKTTYIDAQAALDLFQAGIDIARVILRETSTK